jgi:hypothetical protein
MTTMNVTRADAEEMKRLAIARAVDLKVVELVKYILINAPSIPDDLERSAPLPGSGLILKMKVTGHMAEAEFGDHREFTVKVVSADNPSERVLYYTQDLQRHAYKTFREGPWVALLRGHAEATKYRLANKETMVILKSFSPFGDPRGLRNQ